MVDTDPGERGGLDVHDRVVTRVARRAAREVPGVAEYTEPLDRATGRGLPRADVKRSGRVATVEISVAVSWGLSLGEVAETVRDRVSERLRTLMGLDVTNVDVTVSRIVRPTSEEPRVR